jgi:aspartate carbamoyltransferase catalytic subunit
MTRARTAEHRIPVPESRLSQESRMANGFAGRHVLSMSQYGPGDLRLLFAAAEDMRARVARGRLDRPLGGRLLMSAFFERSTRTRLSHEAAMLRLGGTVSGFADPGVTRAGGSTGESDDDVARMLSLYADVVVVRHPVTGWPARMARLGHGALVINGGDGVGEHPTQALVDLYTLWQVFGHLNGLRVLLTNDLRMRCAHSLLAGLRHFGCTVYGVSAPGKAPELSAAAPELVPRDDLPDLLPDVDVIYSSPTITPAEPGSTRDDGVVLNRRLLDTHANEHAVVLHPLPRRAELATDVDDTRFNGYWLQAANAVPVRMALLSLMLDADAVIG